MGAKSQKLFLIILITYLAILFGFSFILNRGEVSFARIHLDHSNKYIKNGFSEISSIVPDFTQEEWFLLPQNTYNAKEAGFLDEYKRPFLSFTDAPNGLFTYAIEFTITSEQYNYYMHKGLTPALFLPGIADNWDAYINGSLIRNEFYLGDRGVIKTHRDMQMYAIPFPASDMRPGKNFLIFRIISPQWLENFALYRDGGYFIDDYSIIQMGNSGYFKMIMLGISFFIAFFYLLVYIRNKSERFYLYYSLFLILFSVYTAANTQLVYLLIKNTIIISIVGFGCIALLGIPLVLFIKKISNIKVNLFDKLVFGAAILTAVLLPFGGYQFKLDLLLLAEYLLVFFLFYTCIVAYTALGKHMRESAVKYGYGRRESTWYVISNTLPGNIALCLTLSALAVIWGVYSLTALKTESDNALEVIFVLIICMAFALIDDVTKTKLAIKNHNEHLENEVNARTADLLEQTKLAQAANETKSKFLATMSHEIRSPMNAVIGMIEIELMKPELPKETLSSLNKIRNSGYSLLGIINDILDLSKIETGKFELFNERYNSASMINDAVQLNITRIGSKPIEFILKVDEAIPSVLIGDELRIKQILNNLLSNAIKYTEKGRVELAISHIASDNAVDLFLKVSDTGQGMKSEDLNRLFSAYSRFNEEVNRNTEGTGLGLNITRQLVKSMGGDIDVKSEFGKGSVFTVRIGQSVPKEVLPLGSIVAQKLEDFSYATQKSALMLVYTLMPYGKVLVVDDNQTNLFVAKGLLSPYKLQVETALSGYEAIKLADANTYDIIFMDHMMPGLDGIETTKQLRSAGYSAAIVALTANAIVGNDAIFMANGFDDFISKPISLTQMDDILKKYVRDAHPAESAEYEIAGKEPIIQNTAALSDDLSKAFMEDARKALEIMNVHSDLLNFTITAHSMKSALENIGEKELSVLAAELERAGNEKDYTLIGEKADGFLIRLSELVDNIAKMLKMRELEKDAEEDEDEDIATLSEQYMIISEAAKIYDIISIEQALDLLEKRKLSKNARKTISNIKNMALCSEFDEIVDLLNVNVNMEDPEQAVSA